MKIVHAAAIILLCSLIRPVPGLTQLFDPARAIAATVQLDSVVITATEQGFEVVDFIALVKSDSSLYEAFHNLRSSTYDFSTEMTFYDKHDDTEATYRAEHHQLFDGRCRTMKTLNEDWTGRFFKGRKQKPRYYTYELYDRVFLTHGMVCTGTATGTSVRTNTGQAGSMERHVSELMTLVFQPGERAQIPLIGKKTGIFSEEMIGFYDFFIHSDTLNGQPVYTFTAVASEDVVKRENQVVFKSLTTYFSKADFRVLAREYALAQNTLAYFFDVAMYIEVTQVKDQYYPQVVKYSGSWNIPMKKRESGTFEVKFSDFQ